MKIAVTGGSGFVGRHVLARLAGVELISIEKNPPSRYVEELLPNVEFLGCDILDLPKLAKLTQNCDAIIHLAGLGAVQASFEIPEAYNKVNVKGTANALEAARTNNIKKFIFASSSQVYGTSYSGKISEDFELKPTSPYGVTKIEGEKLCARYFEEFGIQTVPLRFFNVYGPGQPKERGVVASFVSAVLEGRPATINGSGNQMQDFVFAGDVARAAQIALEKAGSARGMPINVASGKGFSLAELLAKIEKICGKKVVRINNPSSKGDAASLVADISRAKKILGWAPKTGLDEGLKRTIAFSEKILKESKQ